MMSIVSMMPVRTKEELFKKHKNLDDIMAEKMKSNVYD